MCLGEKETYITLVEVHEGVYGAYQAGEQMKWVLYHQCLFWPLMVKDCIEYAMSRVPKAWQYPVFANVGATCYSKTLAFLRSST